MLSLGPEKNARQPRLTAAEFVAMGASLDNDNDLQARHGEGARYCVAGAMSTVTGGGGM